MYTKTELYHPEDPENLKRRHDAWRTAVWLIAAAALVACVLFCVFTNTANADRMELWAVAVFAAAGWVVIYLSTFTVAALAHEGDHARRMLAAEKTVIRGRVKMERETVRIHKSIYVRRLTVTERDRTRHLYVDACRATALERVLGGEERICELDVAGGYVTAFVVHHEST